MAELSPEVQRAREKWFRNPVRPANIETPGPGEESVWDYPRPPRLERVARRVRVELDGVQIADSGAALRVCETASPPTYYLPMADVHREYLEPSASPVTLCEWKGPARYWSVRAGGLFARDAAWDYPDLFEEFRELRDHLGFFAGRVDCQVGDWRVVPQPGGFYGGWITPEIRGPFKGEPGSEGW